MCKEGIRIGRGTNSFGVTVTTNPGVPVQALPRRLDRLALAITWAGNVTDPVARYAFAQNGQAVASARIGVVHTLSPNIYLTVEQFGELVTGEVWIDATGGANAIAVTEVFLIESLDEAAKQ